MAGCIDRCQGKTQAAQQLLSILDKDLETASKRLANYHEQRDIERLSAELHRLLGGVCYLAVPRLAKALENFHNAIKAQTETAQQTENAHRALQKTIQAFQQAHKALQL